MLTQNLGGQKSIIVFSEVAYCMQFTRAKHANLYKKYVQLFRNCGENLQRLIKCMYEY